MTRKSGKVTDKIRDDIGFRHDLNNHLMTIYNYAEILANDLPPDDRKQRFAKSICVSALAIQNMVGEYNPRKTAAAPKKTVSATILILDDQPDIREIMAIMLQEEGYDVTACEKPSEAIEDIRKKSGKIDLLIADYSMPGMTGAEFADHVHLDYPDIPVIIVSGQEQSTLDKLQRMKSIKAIVKKPVIPEQLLESIEKVLS